MFEQVMTAKQSELLAMADQIDLTADRLKKLNEIKLAQLLSIISTELYNQVSVQLIPPAP
jgi:hypothetical protein